MKKIKFGALFLALALMAMPAEAAVVEFTIDNPCFVVEENGASTEKCLEAAPFIKDGRTMVPVRAISEALGAEIGWDEGARKVTVKQGEKELSLVIGSLEATVGGEIKALDAAPEIINGRTFVPLRFISENFDSTVQYVASTRQVIVENTPVAMTCNGQVATLLDLKTAYGYFYEQYKAQAVEMGEEEYRRAVAQVALEAVDGHLYVRSTFPEVALSETDTMTVQIALETDSLTDAMPYPASFARFIENAYFQNGIPIVDSIYKSTDIAKLYAEEYVCAKHVLVDTEELANEVYEKAITGANFDALIQEYNTDPGVESYPDGYVFTVNEMVLQFQEAVYTSDVGTITKPVKTDYGYHVIYHLPLPELTEDQKQEIALNIARKRLEKAEIPRLAIEQDALVDMLIQE